ncbi:Arc family DNA-binding protein [Acetobacter ghanensis]|uniref:Arc family DNA-binding protein n=2 Tax=Acetobacter ghanensis TaxID=431306 RepID=A0ABX0KLS3_9PROT|nr:Arc family DNA-binding protein [Acetobacter ghanensis]GBQ46369.1 hypothetical protein AA18895_0743 [Acetobacter ghanensis DSM 18895]
MVYKSSMSDERRVPITLRMPRALLDDLKAEADARSHSMNAEIVHRLQESVYLSRSALTFEGGQMTDAERAVLQAMRNMDDEHRKSLVMLLSTFSKANDAT